MAKVSGSARIKELLVLFCVTQLCIIVILLATRDLDKPTESTIQDSGLRRQNQLETGRASPVKYEKTKRRLRSVVEELWYFMGYQLKTLHEDISRNRTPAAERVAKILDQGIEYKRILLQNIEKLSEVDGYNTWRSREANELSDLVQRRLRFLQNPKNCRNARKLVCNLKKPCGFGCQLHHIVYCLMTAYSSQRTMILISQGWQYNGIGWESVFQPLSNNCNGVGSVEGTFWKGFDDRRQVVNLPIVEFFEGNHPYLPRAVPKDLAERISHIHEVPAVWWVGQFVKYLMRLQPSTNNMIIEAKRNMKFKHPIVGVHIRRTDKLNREAAYHSVAEYMNNVEEYYAQLYHSRKVEIKRMYLASDDVTVFDEIRTKYPDYTIVGNRNISEKTAKKRHCGECLNGLIVDIYLLASSDFLVCTFSSQVCRVAYELMQSLYPDASARFRSLDDLYYFGGGGMHRVVATVNHRATSADQIDLNVGDHVKIQGNLWNGVSEGLNIRTGQKGVFPSFKVEELVEAIDFPSAYPQVPHKLIPGQNYKKDYYLYI